MGVTAPREATVIRHDTFVPCTEYPSLKQSTLNAHRLVSGTSRAGVPFPPQKKSPQPASRFHGHNDTRWRGTSWELVQREWTSAAILGASVDTRLRLPANETTLQSSPASPFLRRMTSPYITFSMIEYDPPCSRCLLLPGCALSWRKKPGFFLDVLFTFQSTHASNESLATTVGLKRFVGAPVWQPWARLDEA